jgi:hydroxyethylthiazole kinase-like uncharacterized protein yjeF
MLTEVKKADVINVFPKRDNGSHKGQNGRVLIVGGSRDYYGAPILSAMGALFAGTDLVTLCIPTCNFDVSRSYYPDFIVKSFPGNYLDARSVEMIVELSATQDCLVMGPGLGDHHESLTAVEAITKKAKCPVILDAQAIYGLPRNNTRNNHNVLITPHAQEFANVFERRFPSLLIEKVEAVKASARKLNVNILLKNPVDIVASPQGNFCINQTGNAGMTSGGTGDVLAGVVGSLVARGLSLYDAARLGVFITCTTGDDLVEKKGPAFTATDLAHHLPYTIQRLLA